MGDSYSDRTYRTIVNIEEVSEICNTNDSDFIEKVELFNRTQVAQLLTILNATLYNDTRILETDPNGETSMQTAVNNVKKTLSDLARFQNNFAPIYWINPLNIDINSGDSIIINKLSNLIYEISSAIEPTNAIQSIEEYYNRVNGDGIVPPLAGLNVQSLFALALAYDIDPYDPNPSMNIPPPNKAKWLTISTEVINLVLMLLTIEYVRSGKQPRSIPEEIDVELNVNTLNEAIDTNISLSEIFKDYVNTGDWVISTTDTDASCDIPTPGGGNVITYQDLVRTFSEDLEGNFDTLGDSNARSNFRTCALLVLKQGLNQLRALDNSFNVEFPDDFEAPEFLQQVARGEGDGEGDYDQDQNKLNHPVYYLFIFNLIELITSVEMQLGISPFNYITKTIEDLASQAGPDPVVRGQVLNTFQRALNNSACAEFYNLSPMPTASEISTDTFSYGVNTGNLLGDTYSYIPQA